MTPHQVHQRINALSGDARCLIADLFSKKVGDDTASPPMADQIAAQRAADFVRYYTANVMSPAAIMAHLQAPGIGASIRDLIAARIVEPRCYMDSKSKCWFWRFTPDGLEIAKVLYAEASR